MSKGVTRAAFVKAAGGIELRDVDLPELEKGSLRVRMKASGVCGTDLEKITGRGITSSILGHEVSGVVSESLSPDFAPGDSVVPHHHVSCNECYLCKAGAETMCEGFRTSNFVPGGFADEFIVPAYNVDHGGVHKLEHGLAFDEASFAEPLGCCIRGLRHAELFSNSPKNILVVGAGPIGLLHMELIRSLVPEVRISAADIMKSRLEFAARNEGAVQIPIGESSGGEFSQSALNETNGHGFDLVIVATGSAKAFGESLKCVRKAGRVLLFGAPHKGSLHNLDLSRFFLDEFTINSSYSTTEQELGQALDMLQKKKINVRKFITSTYPLGKIEQAFSSARLENQVKVVVTS
jgi:L-iditol 2-dehydrogenase